MVESFRGQSPRTVLLRTRLPMLAGEARVLLARAAGLATRRPRRPPPGSPLRILADVDTYPPGTRAGSERSLETILRSLAARGHEVRVLVPASHPTGTFGGVEVHTVSDERERRAQYAWSDVVCTQLEAHDRVARASRRARRPLVHFLRLGHFNHLTTYGLPDLLVYNAQWIRDRYPWPGRSIVVHSPIDPAEFRTTPGTFLTIVNLNAKKGGGLLPELAARLPGHRFLAVVGSWGHQLVPDPMPANVELMPNTPDAREIYRRTRVLLHPSVQEAHPRIGLEAGASGIPTIANPIPGTREALGEAAVYVDRDDVDGWVAAIRHLDDEAEWSAWSERARRRTEEKASTAEVDTLEQALLDLVGRPG